MEFLRDGRASIIKVAMFQRFTDRIMNPPAFGLDISDLTVKVGDLERRGDTIRANYLGEFSIPEGLIVDGEIQKEPEFTAVIREWFRGEQARPVRIRTCIASLPEEKSFVRILELPNVKADDVGHAVRWEVEGVVPLPAEEIFYDYELVVGSTPAAGHRDVLITAFPKKIIESYYRVIAGAGLLPLALELESQAISRAVVTDALAAQSLILIDIGAVRTSFIIFAGGSLVFTKSVAIGGRDFERSIADGLGVPIEEAREIKIEAGISRTYRGGRVWRALEPLLVRMASELKDVLAFFRDHPRRLHAELADISAVYLCGGDANLIGLERYLATAVKKPTVLAEPFARLALPPGAVPPIPRNDALKYTTTIGLALRGIGF